MFSIDGIIDCSMTEKIEDSEAYYQALNEFDTNADLEGRVTMQMHTALPDSFCAKDKTPIGKTQFFKFKDSSKYQVGIDTHWILTWPADSSEKDLLIITDEKCPYEYHQYLSNNGISWIAVGKDGIDFVKSMNILYTEFNVKRLAVVGGGHINSAFLQAKLLDEVSLIVGAGIDGRKGMCAVFDGIEDQNYPVTLLKLNEVKRIGENCVWMRYTFR